MIGAVVLVSALVGSCGAERMCGGASTSWWSRCWPSPATSRCSTWRRSAACLSHRDPVITGRYLLVLLPLYGVMLALAVSWLPRRWGAMAAGALVGGVVVLQIAAMGVLFARFYA